MKIKIYGLIVALFLLMAQVVHAAQETDSNAAILAEIKELRSRIDALEKKLAQPQAQPLSRVSADMLTPPVAAPTPAGSAAGAAGSFNPSMSAILDTYYHADNSSEGISHLTGEVSGFGHTHGGEEHHHHGIEEGLNLRHVELQFSADVDPYFKGNAIAAFSEDGAELEVAEIETLSLPAGFCAKGGKFFSDFGYINAQHSHQWDFVDQPLIYQLALGEHGLNDIGAQLSWLAPTPFYLLAGAEVFQGDNERAFAYDGEDPLPSHSGPRVGVCWLKFGPNLAGNHGLQLGVFGASGRHQEAHDGDGDGAMDHYLDGDTSFWGCDGVYKYNSPQAYGQGDIILQAEYFRSRKDMELTEHYNAPQLIGADRVNDQDGYYAQVVYGFLPRWRAGLRFEQVGLTNKISFPDGSSEEYGSSDRVGLMLDYSFSEFSRLRLQFNRGSYETDEGTEDVNEIFIQWTVSVGAHGSHKF